MTRRLALSASLTVIAALGLTACGTTSTPTPRPTHATAAPTEAPAPATVEPADDPTPAPSLDRRELTRMSIDITWDAATPADQQSMCNGIEMFGLDWSAAQLRKGGDSDVLDWDYAAQIIQGKCGL